MKRNDNGVVFLQTYREVPSGKILFAEVLEKLGCGGKIQLELDLNKLVIDTMTVSIITSPLTKIQNGMQLRGSQGQFIYEPLSHSRHITFWTQLPADCILHAYLRLRESKDTFSKIQKEDKLYYDPKYRSKEL